MGCVRETGRARRPAIFPSSKQCPQAPGMPIQSAGVTTESPCMAAHQGPLSAVARLLVYMSQSEQRTQQPQTENECHVGMSDYRAIGDFHGDISRDCHLSHCGCVPLFWCTSLVRCASASRGSRSRPVGRLSRLLARSCCSRAKAWAWARAERGASCQSICSPSCCSPHA